MNLSRCFVPRQLLFLLAAGLVSLIDRQAHGQETITLRNGQTQQVRILGVTSSGIKVQMGAAVMVQPFYNLSQVTMNPPPEYTAAVAAYEAGDLKRASTLTQSVNAGYRGLPTEWAREAMLMMGDIDVGLGQLPQAEEAYKDFQRVYPGAGAGMASVGMAQIDVEHKDYAAAQAKIGPLLDAAMKDRTPPKATAALIGRAYYVAGKIKEQAGDLPGALEDYLRTVVIFPEDRLAAASARERADALRKEHGTVVP